MTARYCFYILVIILCFIVFCPRLSIAATLSTISTGANHSLALRSDGTTIAWGNNDSGQCSIPVPAQTQISAVSAGWMYSLALKNGAVVGWGDDSCGQTDIPASAQSGVSAIASGGTFALALKSGGVIAWGDNFYGQSSVPPGAQTGVVAISAGFAHALALKSDGSLIAWGANFSNQASIPAGAASGVKAIAAGAVHSLALKNDGTLVAWGDASLNAITIPASLQSGVTAIAAGGNFSMALKGSTVTLWGDTSAGAAPADWNSAAAISAGGAIATALTGNGNASTWGNSDSGSKGILLVTLDLAGTGSGSVNSDPSGLSCSNGSCASTFPVGTDLDLVASAATGSHFAGWAGACAGTAHCSLKLVSSIVATSTFDPANPHAIVLETGILYALVNQAYEAAADGNTIRMLAGPLNEKLKFDGAKAVFLQGGYDQSFKVKAGTTSVLGPLEISKGHLVADGVVVTN